MGHSSYICFEDHEIVGFIIYLAINNEIHLLNIAIRPAFQNMGYGTLMLDFLKNQATVLGISLIYLEVRVSNINAISFYKKHGFKSDAIRNNYYSKPFEEDALLMSLKI